jgi:Lar family restriction alleviation protein
MKELKPCPFCGGEAKLTKGITYLDNYVTCCECFSRTKTYNTKESAIKSWNKRNAWIPCEERLPEKSGNYIVTMKVTNKLNETYYDVIEATYWSSLKTWEDTVDDISVNVIAWCELPKPYEEKENVD